MRPSPKPYELYKHFKGNTYQIICIAKDSEDDKEKVVYQGMYEPYAIYVRDLEMFMEEVDKVKYPNAAQRYRFELIEKENSTNASSDLANKAKEYITEDKTEDIEERIEEKSENINEVEDSVTTINNGLLRFLDAESDEEKLEIITGIKEELNENILTSIELSLGMEAGDGDIMDRYREVKNFLLLKQKYERRHR